MEKVDTENAIACSLNDEEFRERRTLARETFRTSVISTKRMESGLRLGFTQTKTLRRDIEKFVELEKQCCSFLTFTMSPEFDLPGKPIHLLIQAPHGAEDTLDMFARIVEIHSA